MNTPRRRIWLYPDGEAIEISLFGPLDAIGPMFARIKGAAQRWPGFRQVEIIGSGSTVAVLRAELTIQAGSLDPVAETMMMFDEYALLDLFEWSTSDRPALGVVGTW